MLQYLEKYDGSWKVMIKRNYRGEILTGPKELIKKEYGTGKINSQGDPIVDWSCLSPCADKDGFDTRKFINKNSYKIEMILPKGTIILRYGSEMGRFTAPDGTDYEKLALPYKKESIEFYRYRVLQESVKVTCIVDKGIVAPGFNSPGGAVQYLHKKTIYDLLNNHVIERIY